MKHAFISVILIVLGLSVILSSGCKDSGSDPQNSAPGKITGIVQIYDTTHQAVSNSSGVNISLEGTSFSTISDESGKWKFTNVPAGIYTLVFSKDHYLTDKYQNVEFSGNGTLLYNLGGNLTPIYPIPNIFPNLVIRPFEDDLKIGYTIDSIIRDSNGLNNYYYHLDTVITKSENAAFSSRSQYLYGNQSVNVSFFFSAVPEIDPALPASYLYHTPFFGGTSTETDTSGIVTIFFRKSDLIKSGFTPNQTVYCCAYAYIYLNTWYDPDTYKAIYSGFSPYHSEVKSFVIP